MRLHRLHPLRWSAALLAAGAVAIFASPASADFGTAADCMDPSAHCVPSGQVTLNLSQSGVPGTCRFDVTIDWGDGHSDSYSYAQSTTASHTYASPGVYEISADGTASALAPHTTCTETPFQARVEVPAPGVAAPVVQQPPASPPTTSLSRHPARKIRARGRLVKVTFRFSGRGGPSGFQCKLDNHPFANCASPVSYWVKRGRHTFSVRALGLGGIDPTPATFTFTVVKRH